MKTITTIFLTIFSLLGYSQNTDMAKPLLKQADSLYASKQYNKAYDGYMTAYRYDRVASTRTKIDSCIYYKTIQEKEANRVISVNATIKQLKDNKTVLIFDSNGNAISYQNEGKEAKPISQLTGDSHDKLSSITLKDWNNYK